MKKFIPLLLLLVLFSGCESRPSKSEIKGLEMKEQLGWAANSAIDFYSENKRYPVNTDELMKYASADLQIVYASNPGSWVILSPHPEKETMISLNYFREGKTSMMPMSNGQGGVYYVPIKHSDKNTSYSVEVFGGDGAIGWCIGDECSDSTWNPTGFISSVYIPEIIEELELEPEPTQKKKKNKKNRNQSTKTN